MAVHGLSSNGNRTDVTDGVFLIRRFLERLPVLNVFTIN
jgi:hypothetical protein